MNAAEACLANGISTTIVFESRDGSRASADSITEHPRLKPLREKDPASLRVVHNAWMPFFRDEGGKTAVAARPRRDQDGLSGCGNLLESVIVTPHKKVAACCGLTMEHIPEMKVGDLNEPGGDIVALYRKQANDLIKIWLWVDGPEKILKLAAERAGQAYPDDIRHPCHACAILHSRPALRDAVLELAPSLATSIFLRAKVRARLMNMERKETFRAGCVEGRLRVGA